MFIFVVGLNHRTAPVEIRERFSFSENTLGTVLTDLRGEPGIEGCAVLATCNRTEFYAATTDMEKGLTAVRRFVLRWGNLSPEDYTGYFYSHTLYDAIRHLFRVAAGLDSMVVGETQILGQVRQAYQFACTHGSSNGIVNTWFQQAITVGKRVRTETAIDQHAVSISYIGVELARQVLGDLVGKTVLVLGAGKMSDLTLKHLLAYGVKNLLVTNRSAGRAQELACRWGGRAVPFNALATWMVEADIVISCTAASHFVIEAELGAKVMAERANRPLVLVDIAVPRDIDPLIADLPGMHLYDIDDLQQLAEQNLGERRRAAVQAEEIIEQEIEDFFKWLNSRFIIPTIIALKAKGEAIKQTELERVLGKLKHLPAKEKKLIGSLASSIVNQLLHDPITQVRCHAASPEGHLYSEILQNLFCLDVPGQRLKHPVSETDSRSRQCPGS
ncbi:MAG: glutamyl-tRNA reductase [Heliobacteriaceae bacterium]|nr:glutamyl-tRNA reductase [Heliobacteriaceae bacterium]